MVSRQALWANQIVPGWMVVPTGNSDRSEEGGKDNGELHGEELDCWSRVVKLSVVDELVG